MTLNSDRSINNTLRFVTNAASFVNLNNCWGINMYIFYLFIHHLSFRNLMWCLWCWLLFFLTIMWGNNFPMKGIHSNYCKIFHECIQLTHFFFIKPIQWFQQNKYTYWNQSVFVFFFIRPIWFRWFSAIFQEEKNSTILEWNCQLLISIPICVSISFQ